MSLIMVVERATGGRPTKARSAALTERLLDKARELFCLRGFAGTSIDEIASALKASKHTIYNRYGNKLKLLEAVVDRDVARFRQALLDAGKDQHDALGDLHDKARVYFGFSATPGYSALYAALALEAASSMHLRGRLRDWAAISLEPLQAAIARVPAHDDAAAMSAEEACGLLIDLMDGQANRAKWMNAADDADALESMFEARWLIFRRAMSVGA